MSDVVSREKVMSWTHQNKNILLKFESKIGLGDCQVVYIYFCSCVCSKIVTRLPLYDKQMITHKPINLSHTLEDAIKMTVCIAGDICISQKISFLCFFFILTSCHQES